MDKQAKDSLHAFPSSKEVTREKYCQGISFDCAKEDSYTSSNSLSSSISSDFMEDSSSSTSSSSSSNGPLFHLSDLMDQLPIKRGLSKYYQGRSQSFASLASVESLQDLAKRANPYKKRIKSFCRGIDDQRFISPKATISKKASYKIYSSAAFRRNCNNSFMATCELPSTPIHDDF